MSTHQNRDLFYNTLLYENGPKKRTEKDKEFEGKRAPATAPQAIALHRADWRYATSSGDAGRIVDGRSVVFCEELMCRVLLAFSFFPCNVVKHPIEIGAPPSHVLILDHGPELSCAANYGKQPSIC